MFQSHHRFFLGLADAAGRLLHREEIDDYAACYEDLLFTAVCCGAVDNDGSLPPATLDPVWDDRAANRIVGVTVSLSSLRKTYDLSVVAGRVQRVLAARDTRKEEAKASGGFSWWVEAHERTESDVSAGLRVSVSRQPYPLVRSTLATFGIHEQDPGEGPLALFIRRDVLDALLTDTGRCLDRERADILTGHLVQDPAGQVAVVVTGRAPIVTGIVASRTHFAFSPVTFVTARREVERQSGGASIVGWHHNHPPPCGSACLQSPPRCPAATLFFSVPNDHEVHRASFPAAHMVALVSGKEAHRRPDEPGMCAWGWRDGAIAQRPFSTFTMSS